MEFKPERFLGSDDQPPETDSGELVFGYGRRICPGRILADAQLYLIIAQTLAAFNLNKVSVNGQVVEPEVRFEGGMVSRPAKFSIDAKPRSSEYEALVRAAKVEFPALESDAKLLQSMLAAS